MPLEKKWKIIISGNKTSESGADFFIEFIDADELFGPTRKITISQNLLDDLVHNVRKYKNYYVIKALKQVVPPREKSISGTKNFIAIFGITKDKIKMGFLLQLTRESILLLIGLWPSELAQAIAKKVELLDNIITAMGQVPEYWERIDILLLEKKHFEKPEYIV